MKPSLFGKIQSQWENIIQNLDVMRVCDVLMTKLTLIPDELQRIKNQVTTNDKARQLLEILKLKEDKHFENFLAALDATDHEYIADAIRQAEVPDDYMELAYSGAAASTSSSSSTRIPHNGPINTRIPHNGPINTRIPHNGPINTISSLRPDQEGWKIQACVTMKGEIETKRKKNSAGGYNQIKYFRFKVIDETGEIEGVAFNDAVDNFYNVIKLNKAFYISGATLDHADMKFNSTLHNYKIVINKYACIMPCQDAGDISPYGKFDFTSIDKLQDSRPGELVDIIAVVKEYGESDTVKTKKRKNIVKREIQLVDQSGMQVGLTLWKSDAEHFLGRGNPVLAFKGVKISEWAGRSLTMLPNSQKFVNPKIPEAEELRLWFSNEGKQMKFTGFS